MANYPNLAHHRNLMTITNKKRYNMQFFQNHLQFTSADHFQLLSFTTGHKTTIAQRICMTLVICISLLLVFNMMAVSGVLPILGIYLATLCVSGYIGIIIGDSIDIFSTVTFYLKPTVL